MNRSGSTSRRGTVVVAALVLMLSAGCSATGDDSKAAARATPTSAASSSSSAEGVLLPGRVIFMRTTGNDVTTLVSLTHGTEKTITRPGDFDGGAPSPDGRLLLGGGAHPGHPYRGVTARVSDGALTPLHIPDPTLNLAPSAWAPDGKRILYLGWDDGDPRRTGIYVADYPSGAHLHAIRLRPGRVEDEPIAYSPDGSQVLFYRATAPDPDPHLNGSLWVMPAAGGTPHKISGSVQPYDLAAWSPDGSRIVFATTRLQPHGSIWVAAPDGTKLTEVVRDPLGGYPVTPSWSPDGKQILFGLDTTNDDFQHLPNQLYVMDADGTHLQRVRTAGDGDGIMRNFH